MVGVKAATLLNC